MPTPDRSAHPMTSQDERDRTAALYAQATWPKGADLDDGRGAADVWIIAAILRDALGRIEALEAKS